MKGLLAFIFILCAAIGWGTSGLFVRNLGGFGLTTFEIVFLRLLLSTIIICIVFLIFDRAAFKIKLKDVWCFIGTGVVGVMGCSLCYFYTIEHASLSLACILMYTSPIFVCVLSRFLFKEKFTLLKIIGLVGTFGGSILCVYEKGAFSITLPALLMGIGSGICFGSYSVFTRLSINKGCNVKTILLYTFIFACISSAFFVDYGHAFTTVKTDFSCLWDVCGIAVIASLLPYFLYTLGLKNLDTGTASILSCMEIVASLVVGIIAFKEYPSPFNVIGIIVVICASIILNLKIDKVGKKNDKTSNC